MQFPNARGAIALAVYQPQPELIATQFRTIAAQTVAGWHCHIGIDGHDDATHQLVLGLVAGDPRFVVHHYPENVGIFRNFERLVGEISTGAEWFALSDQDDAWDEDKLERMLAALVEDGGLTAIVGQARVVDRDGASLGRTHRRHVSLAALLLDNQVTGSLAVFRRGVLDVALPFPRPTPAAYHDHWLGAVAAASGRIRFLADDVQDYVQHADNALGEEHRRGPAGRLRSLAGDKPDPRRMLDRLAIERWGWRRTMASTLMARLPEDAAAARVLATLSTPGVGVLRSVVASVVRREVGVQRALAIWVGSVWDRWAAPRPAHDSEAVVS